MWNTKRATAWSAESGKQIRARGLLCKGRGGAARAAQIPKDPTVLARGRGFLLKASGTSVVTYAGDQTASETGHGNDFAVCGLWTADVRVSGHPSRPVSRSKQGGRERRQRQLGEGWGRVRCRVCAVQNLFFNLTFFRLPWIVSEATPLPIRLNLGFCFSLFT